MSEQGRNAVTGAVALVALAFLGYFVFLYLGGFFRPGFEVTGRFERAGQLLRDGSDVKLRGVLVGEVARVDVTDAGRALVSMRIFPDQDIPDNVHAAIRAKTLFGEKFVELRLLEEPSQRRLGPGDEIPVERTIGPFEVETILEQAIPILTAVDPENFAAALQALAQGFVGNEEALRRATLQGERVLTETERTLPHLERNLVHLRNFAQALDEADEDLLEVMSGLELVGRALTRRAPEFRTTMGSLAAVSRDLADIVTAREGDLADLAAQGRPVLELVADRADQLPDVVRLLDGFLGVWILDLSEGPYWRILFSDDLTGGQPYPPGQEPSPRTAQALPDREETLRRIAGDPDVPPPSLTDILLAPVPDEALNGFLDRIGVPDAGADVP